MSDKVNANSDVPVETSAAMPAGVYSEGAAGGTEKSSEAGEPTSGEPAVVETVHGGEPAEDWQEVFSRLWLADTAREMRAAGRATVLLFGVALFAIMWTILTNFATPEQPAPGQDQLTSAYSSAVTGKNALTGGRQSAI